MSSLAGFAGRHPLAWLFHRNTALVQLHAVELDRSPEASFKEYLGAPAIPLPEPALPPIPLAEALALRLSCRRFAPLPLPLAKLATLLHTAYGVHGRSLLFEQEFLERPVPSGGGLYPLESYLLATRVDGLASGIYHYAPLGHLLEQCGDATPAAPQLARLFLGQPYVGDAAGVLVLTAVVERSLWKYRDRGYRYLLFEAGHVAQNVNLVAAALGIGALDLGGFLDVELGELLGLDPEMEIPLYGIAVGSQAAAERSELRQPGTGA
jgi:SagB-type dehydrogenase family enzyme